MVVKRNPQEKSQGNVLNISNEKMFEAIRKRAYELYCKRGYSHGNDMNDWLQAEKEIKRQMGLMR